VTQNRLPKWPGPQQRPPHCAQIGVLGRAGGRIAAVSSVGGAHGLGGQVSADDRPVGRSRIRLVIVRRVMFTARRRILVPDALAQLAVGDRVVPLRHLTGALPLPGERPVEGYRPAPVLVASRGGGRGQGTDVPWRTPMTYSLPEGKRSGNVILTAGDQALSGSAGHLRPRAWVLS
jgi:hypothetical protein